MFKKRTRLFINFNLINFFHIIKCLIINKKNLPEYIKKFFKTDNIDLTSYGRSALYEIVKIIIENSNKKIFFISPYTIPAVIHAIKYAGGEVSYIDIDKKTGLIDSNQLEKKIDTNSAAVIITHLYSKKEDIKNFISKFNNKITIIEDAAINFGAKINNQYLGTLADFGFFSFAMVKNLNTFTGGAIFIKDDKTFKSYLSKKKLKKFPKAKTINLIFTAMVIKMFFNNFSYQITHFFLKFVYKNKINFILRRIYPVLYHNFEDEVPELYFHDFNWIMNDVGIYNFKNIEKDLNERIRKAKIYNQEIADAVALKTHCFNGENCLLEYTIILKKSTCTKIHKDLMDKGYDIRHTWYINNVKSLKNLKQEDFEQTFYLENKILCLPVHKNVSDQDIKKISSIINNHQE